jgi:hypothetical protein
MKKKSGMNLFCCEFEPRMGTDENIQTANYGKMTAQINIGAIGLAKGKR